MNVKLLGNPPVQVQQRVQILRGPDGKLQVRGLLPTQQLVQMPDGKLHVLNVSHGGTHLTQCITTNSTTPTTTLQVIYLNTFRRCDENNLYIFIVQNLW